MTTVTIDDNSGFCFGVVTAIRKAEEQLDRSGSLYCLGDIVHNTAEMERLREKGLSTINHNDLLTLKDTTVLLRAHGEPPSTYSIARQNGITIVDATCPVVLRLQQQIKADFDRCRREYAGKGLTPPLFLIYGKKGHAEVNGLVGQTDGEAVVVQDIAELDSLDLDRDIMLYSQTTKSLEGFRQLVDEIKSRKRNGSFRYYDTICRQVARRMEQIREFANSHDAIVFVSGAKSSNGKVLYQECLNVNPDTFLVSDINDLDVENLKSFTSIGICGATSTPRWLMAEIASKIETHVNGK